MIFGLPEEAVSCAVLKAWWSATGLATFRWP